jgi:hypothetical protein
MHTGGGRSEMGQTPRDTARGADYLSYLLRMWQESGDEAAEGREAAVWRASLTSPTTGERVGFASIEGLVEYLQERMDTAPDSGAHGGAGHERR